MARPVAALLATIQGFFFRARISAMAMMHASAIGIVKPGDFAFVATGPDVDVGIVPEAIVCVGADAGIAVMDTWPRSVCAVGLSVDALCITAGGPGGGWWVWVGATVGVGVAVGVGVGVGVGVTDGPGEGDGDGDGLGVGVKDAFTLGLGEGDGLGPGDGEGLGLGEGDGLGVGVGVSVAATTILRFICTGIPLVTNVSEDADDPLAVATILVCMPGSSMST